MTSGIVLSSYPLSRAYAEAIRAAEGGDARFLVAGQLSDKRPWKLLANVRRLRAERLSIALEDPASGGSLPMLKMIAAASSARDLFVYGPDLERRRFGRPRQLVEAARLACACLQGFAALAEARRRLAALARRPRIEPPARPAARKVAYINTNLWFGVRAGGSVGHISGVANGFLGRGLAVDYYSVGGRLMLRDAISSVDLEPPRTWALPYALNHYRFDRAFERQVRPRIEPGETAFLYQRLSLANFAGVRLSRALGLPLVVEYNGSEVWVADKWGSGLRFRQAALAAEIQTLRHAHVVVTVSDVLRDELAGRGIEPGRIVSYPNCIDPEVFDPARFGREAAARIRAAHRIPADACVATFVGTFGAWHGAEVLARAIADLCASRRAEIEAHGLHFLFVGDGLRLPEVRRILDDGGRRPWVRFTGLVPQAEAPAYLAASDILVAPHVANADGSRFFGSPTKLFEYMAMGKAILASDLDQIGEVLRESLRLPGAPAAVADRPLAVLLPPGDPAALADGLMFLAGRPDVRERLGHNARLEALRKYTWDRHVAAILERVDSLASAPAGASRGRGP